MKIPFSQKQLNNAQAEVVALNNLKESYIRPMCFYGSEGLGIRFDGLSIHTIVAAWEWPSYMDPEAQVKGIKVKWIQDHKENDHEETKLIVDLQSWVWNARMISRCQLKRVGSSKKLVLLKSERYTVFVVRTWSVFK